MAFEKLYASFASKYLEQKWLELNRRIEAAFAVVPALAGSTFIRIPVGSTPGTVLSTAVVPGGSLVVRCAVKINSAYDGGATIRVETTGGTTFVFQTVADNDPSDPDTYELVQYATLTGAEAGQVRVVLAGASTTGAAVVVVEFAASPLS